MWNFMKCFLPNHLNIRKICYLYIAVLCVGVIGKSIGDEYPGFVSFLQEPFNPGIKDSFIVESRDGDGDENEEINKIKTKIIKNNEIEKTKILSNSTKKPVANYNAELDLVNFMRPSHGIILPLHKNTSNVPSSLWSFFEHETTKDVDKDENEYIADMEDEKSLISPLVNLPIITNLITGKSLDFNAENSNPSSRSISNSSRNGDDGFDIKIQNKKVGNIMSLPENARMDLEDPLTENYFIEETEESKNKRNQTTFNWDSADALSALNKTYSYLTNMNNLLDTELNITELIKNKSNYQNSTPAYSNQKHKTVEVQPGRQKYEKLNHTNQVANSSINGVNNQTKLKSQEESFKHTTHTNNTFHQIKKNQTKQNSTQSNTLQQIKSQNKVKQFHHDAITTSLHLQTNTKVNKDKTTSTVNTSDKWNGKLSHYTKKPFYNTSHTRPLQTIKNNFSKKMSNHKTESSDHEITFKNVKEIFDQIIEHAKPKPNLVRYQGSSESKHSDEANNNLPKNYENHEIEFVQLPPNEDTHCMDGSSPAYYKRNGYGDGKGRWIIHLHGGAWCYDLRSCSKRRNSILGSSNRSLEEDIGGFFHGILSNDPLVNPHFYNWNTAVLTYCDGGLFSGNRDKPLIGNGKKYYFQGRRVLRSQLNHIKETSNLDKSTNIILSGTSAGGLSLLLQANYIRIFLPPLSKVRGLVDAGFFLDQDSIWNTSISNIQFKALYSLHRPTLSRSCIEQQTVGKKFKCLFPHETVQNVKIPLFIVNSLYDHWQLSYLEGISCVYDDSKCDQLQHDRVLGFRNKMYTALNDVVKYSNTTGVFANSCFAHGQVILDYTWSKANVNRKTISNAFYDWYQDNDLTSQKRHFHADCKLPCNGSCPRLLARRCVVNFKKASPQRRKRESELC